MKRLAVLGLVVLAMLAITAVSAGVHRDLPQTNDFGLLGALEPFVVLVGGLVASVYLARRPDNARGVLGVGLYSLISGTAFVTVFSFWLSTDDIILDTAFVGALLAMVGTALAIASALTLSGQPTATAQTVGQKTIETILMPMESSSGNIRSWKSSGGLRFQTAGRLHR